MALDAPQWRNFLTQSEHSQYLIVFLISTFQLVVSEILRGAEIYVRGPVHLYTPSGKFFVPEASTSLCRMAFLISTFQLLLSKILGGFQIYTRRPYAPWTPSSGEIFFTYSEYFTISNCVFNFNILPLVHCVSKKSSPLGLS